VAVRLIQSEGGELHRRLGFPTARIEGKCGGLGPYLYTKVHAQGLRLIIGGVLFGWKEAHALRGAIRKSDLPENAATLLEHLESSSVPEAHTHTFQGIVGKSGGRFPGVKAGFILDKSGRRLNKKPMFSIIHTISVVADLIKSADVTVDDGLRAILDALLHGLGDNVPECVFGLYTSLMERTLSEILREAGGPEGFFVSLSVRTVGLEAILSEMTRRPTIAKEWLLHKSLHDIDFGEQP